MRDYTDIVTMIMDPSKRLYHLNHFRNKPGVELNGKAIAWHGNRYVFDLARIYKFNWTPWGKWPKSMKPKDLYFSLHEVLRSKKVGFLIFLKPENGSEDPVYPIHISQFKQPGKEET